jgi:hypothetical protein
MFGTKPGKAKSDRSDSETDEDKSDSETDEDKSDSADEEAEKYTQITDWLGPSIPSGPSSRK